MNEKIQNLLERENLRLATLSARFLAYLFDCFLMLFLCVLFLWGDFALLFNDKSSQDSLNLIKGLVSQFFGLYIALSISYEMLLVSVYGATLGKMILKIRIISVEFVDKPSLLRAILRAIIKSLGAVLLYVEFIIAFDERFSRALHDIVPKTLVVE